MKPSNPFKVKPGPKERMDLFLEGRLKLIQSREGYRFSIDAVLLSEFVTIRPRDTVVDFGTGCGVIPLMLLVTKPAGYAFGLEIQAELASQAMRNALLNGLDQKMKVILGDIKNPPLVEKCADVVICNPPYRQVKDGRINPDVRKAIARHEIMASLDDILRAAKRLLKKKGRLALIYPSVRLVDVLGAMRRFELEPKTIQFIHPDLKSGSKLVLIEAAVNGKPGLEIRAPILGQGSFSILGRL
ncbi:MAG: methyltransferase [Desulfatiglandaceae bacterium]